MRKLICLLFCTTKKKNEKKIEKNHLKWFRKRSLSDAQSEDLDNTRDSVLSGQSHSSFSDNGEPELIIIDFEYCAYNYRGFDLANHFNEWTMDYTNKQYPFYHHKPESYPCKEQQVSIAWPKSAQKN